MTKKMWVMTRAEAHGVVVPRPSRRVATAEYPGSRSFRPHQASLTRRRCHFVTPFRGLKSHGYHWFIATRCHANSDRFGEYRKSGLARTLALPVAIGASA